MLAKVLKPRLTLGRVIDALRNPLYRTGYALVGNTIGTTVVGFIYWVIAAHLYNPEALGRCSALVSALIVVSFLAQLDLQTTLARFLPQAGRSAGRFIAYSYGVSSVAAVAVGVAFVTLLPRLNSHWQFLRTSGPLGRNLRRSSSCLGDIRARGCRPYGPESRGRCSGRELDLRGSQAAPASGPGFDTGVDWHLHRLVGPPASHRPRRELAYLPALREGQGTRRSLYAARSRGHSLRRDRLHRHAVFRVLRRMCCRS